MKPSSYSPNSTAATSSAAHPDPSRRKAHPMQPRILTGGALTLTVLLAGCGNTSDTTTAPSSTPSQHIRGGNDPRYQQGVNAWIAFGKTAPSDVTKRLPAESAKYATAKAIAAEEANRKLWADGSTELGKIKSTNLKTTVTKFQGMDIYLDTPTQPFQMTVRICGTSAGELITTKGTEKINSSLPATLHFKSLDKGSTWKIDQVDVNAPSDIKLGCEAPASSTSASPQSKG